MNVLSLFDGMSCGMLALIRAGIPISNYYASEIDKYAEEVSIYNYKDIHRLGDVTLIDTCTAGNIDLLIGGSPCQGFSFAGKQLNFHDARSKLFFEFVRLLDSYQPNYFLLENVKMKIEHQNIISEALGVPPVEINSSLFSAQDRKRLYWTNIPIPKIHDKGIYLRDILEPEVDDWYFLREDIAKRYSDINYKKVLKKSCVIGKLSPYQGDRVFDVDCKASSLSACGGNNGGGSCNIIRDPATNKLRKLTEIECERLQTAPDNFTMAATRNQRYKMLGNGWTVDVIAHIFKGLL